METSEIKPDTVPINIPFPDTPNPHLWITVGACRLMITPSDGSEWITGTYYDPTGSLPCVVTQEGGTARISIAPNPLEFLGLFRGVPEFRLALGKGRTYSLTIETGASENILDVGGLPITRIEVKHGAGKIDLDFSSPNPVEMSSLQLSAGAGAIDARNLSNANAGEMNVEGGAAGFKLAFGGSLRRDARLRISTGMASVELVVPRSVATKVSAEAVMGAVEVGDGFMKKEGTFQNQAALSGGSPVLTVRSSTAMGSTRLTEG